MAVQFAPTFDQNPLALALALRSKEGNDTASSEMERELQKMWLQTNLQTAGDVSPIQSPWQGYARLANALVGGYRTNQLIAGDRAQNAETNRLLQGLPGLGGGGTPAAQPMPMPAPGPTSEAEQPNPVVSTPPPVQMASADPKALAMALQQPQATQPGMAQPPRPPADIPNVQNGIAGIGPQFVEAIKKSEGFAPKAQWDYKQNTNGYGTRAQYPGEQIDRATADQRLAQELSKAAGTVDKVAPNAPSGARAALASLTYNAGDKWSRSGLGDLVKQGDWQGAQQRFQQYNRAGGAPLAGLVQRRQQEAQWFPPNGANTPLPRPRPTDIPQDPQQPQQPNPEMADAPVRVASLGGLPQGDSGDSAAPAPASAPPNMQMAQAQPQAAQRQTMSIPPEVAQNIKALLANPKTRAYGMQLYQQYAKPTDRFEPVNGADGTPYGQRSSLTGEVKPYPRESDYQINNREDGAIVSVNKNNPKDYHITKPAGAAAELATQQGEVARAKESGQVKGKGDAAVPGTLENAQFIKKTIDTIGNHPGLKWGTGLTGMVTRHVPGTDEYDFQSSVDQLKGRAFIDAFEALRGGGQISNVEGDKATSAKARMDTAQSEKAFREALRDYSDVVNSAVNRVLTQSRTSPEAANELTKNTGPSKTPMIEEKTIGGKTYYKQDGQWFER